MKKTAPETPDLQKIAAADVNAAAGPRMGPEDAVCGDLDIRIDRNGTWFYQGSPIGRKELVKLFASVLSRDEDGNYWLITPVEKGRIEVEDAPFLAVEMWADGSGHGQTLRLRTNIHDTVTVDTDHPITVTVDPETGALSPYVVVRDRIPALISRPIYYQLVELGVEEEVDRENLYGVWSSGTFFPLGKLDETP